MQFPQLGTSLGHFIGSVQKSQDRSTWCCVLELNRRTLSLKAVKNRSSSDCPRAVCGPSFPEVSSQSRWAWRLDRKSERSFYPLNHKGSLGSKECLTNCEYGQDDDTLINYRKWLEPWCSVSGWRERFCHFPALSLFESDLVFSKGLLFTRQVVFTRL